MTRFVSALVLVIAAAGNAHADMGTLPNGVVLTFNRLFTHSGNSATFVQPNLGTEDEWHYFNFAHCECSLDKGRSDPDFHESTYAYEIIPSNAGTAPVVTPGQIWVGTSCDTTDLPTRNMMCRQLTYATIDDIATIQSQHTVSPEISIFDLMTPTGQSQCPEQVLAATEWLLVDTMQTGVIDYSLSATINTDTLAPPLPSTFNANGAENAINIAWTAPDGSTGDPTDIQYFQVLCAGPDGQPAIDAQYRPAPHYITPQSLCNSDFRLGITASDANGDSIDAGAGTSVRVGSLVGDAGIDAPDAAIDAGVLTDDASTVDASTQPGGIPTGFAEYDPSFLCGEADSNTSTSLRVEHLQNNTPYQVMFLTIDKFGNPRGTVFRQTLTPKAVTDFWEDLHDQGSHVEGGFCLLAETYGNDSWPTTALRAFRDNTLAHTAVGRWSIDAYYATLGKLGPLVHGSIPLRIVAGILLVPLVALALVWHYLTIFGLLALLALPLAWRHRRRVLRSRIAPAVATILVICLVPHAARADGKGEPYWEHDGDADAATSLADEPMVAHWQAGLRIGPYTPAIDAQLGKPVYQEMFGGGASILPMIDFERIIWQGQGAVAIGASIGYLSKTAHAYQDMTTPGDPNRPRSEGDTTSFSLVPFALTVVYRATQLDDDYGIPIVPFARLGLAYDVWWVRAPSGDFAQVCSNGGMEPDCSQNLARGASMGITGEIGITVRAERIDTDAARSMREGGLLHAGFFAEYQLAKVDGFGSSTKLAVGDNTWFGGVSFDF